MNIWRDLYERFELAYGSTLSEARVKAENDFFSKEELQRFRVLREDPDNFLSGCLDDKRKRIFVKCLANMAGTIPKILFEPMIKAGVYCVDPSFNKHYLLIPFDINPKKSFKILMHYLTNGTELEAGGTANAFYWFGPYMTRLDGKANLDYKIASIKKFVETDSIDTRRALVAKLNFNENDYPEEHRCFVAKALEIAGKSDDDYIKNRYQILHGEAKLYSALPHRKDDS